MVFRRPRIEHLHARDLMAADWQNQDWPLDVDGSGTVVPLDALMVINDLNREGIRPLGDRVAADAGRPWIDVNGNGTLEPLDALQVINALNEGTRPLTVVAHLAPESDANGNGVILGSQVTILGQTIPGAEIRLRLDDGSVLLPASDSQDQPPAVAIDATADRQGRFVLPVDLPYRMTTFRIEATNRLRQTAATDHVLRRGDLALDWNASALDVIRDWTDISNDPYQGRIVTAQPPVVARNLAMIHVAMHDAMAIAGGRDGYLVEMAAVEVTSGASELAAAAAAAHRVASTLYPRPDERAIWDHTLEESLAAVGGGAAVEDGIAIGRQVGDAILADRATDGWNIPNDYSAGNEPGQWRRSPPADLPPLLPHWGDVRPFAIEDASQVLPPAPPPLSTADYAEALDEVMRLGSLDSDQRSDDETEIARFWADGGGTYTPPGHWNQIAADVAVGQNRNLQENLRMLALLNMAMADAGIASWQAKYAFDLWRPIDAIRNADDDGNPLTASDPTWFPLLMTPPFPTYTSGHSTFSGSAATVLSALLGKSVAFSSASDGQHAFAQGTLDPSLVVSRQFASFEAAAAEAGRSRIYGGIHFAFDDSAGFAAGRAVGQIVIDRFAPEPA